MTYISLSEAAQARLDVLSFFIFSYLILAWLVKVLWNSLAKSFPRMPEINYKRALALMLLSGLLLYVVLTMISGARELLTPGAWERQGVGYRLRDGEAPLKSREEYKSQLQRLKSELWAYAEKNQGQTPRSPFTGELDVSHWKWGPGSYYAYLRPAQLGADRSVVIYEPAGAGARRYVLLNDGSIEDWSEMALRDRLKEQQK